MADIPSDELKPNKVKVEFTAVPGSFDALKGVVGTATSAATYEAEVLSADGDLTVDYIFAPDSEGATLADFKMTFYKDDAEISTNEAFTNIPVRRNYRTNVTGNLLTKKGTINVEVKPEFETPDMEVDLQEVNTVADIAQAIRDGARDIVVKTELTENVEIQLPHSLTEEQAAEKVTITIPKTDKNITFSYAQEEGKATKEIELFVETTGALVLNLPESTVALRGSVGSLEANTAANTLIIGEGVTVNELTVKGGNVQVYGKVGKIVSKPDGTIVSLHVTTPERLADYATTETAMFNKVVIENDIDFKAQLFKIAKVSNVEFDGKGHKISNFTVENLQMAGFVCDAVSVTFRNLTLEKAKVKAKNDGSGNAYAGTFIGRTYGTIVMDKCVALNSQVEGVNKVGGLVGFVAEDHIEATDCKVEGCIVSNEDVPEESGQMGGFVGYLGNLYSSTCSFKNCSIEKTTINAYMNWEDRTISKFIGCFQGNQAGDIVTIDNCTVSEVTLNGMNEMAQSFVSTYGDLLGGQRYGKGMVTITNSDVAVYISNRMQLAQLATLVNAGNSFAKKTVKLATDIDLENIEWTPIGKKEKAFQGIFDGCGYIISNLKIDKPVNNSAANEHQGLFGYTTEGEVKNFTLHNAKVKAGFEVGAVAGTPYTSKYSNIKLTGLVQVEGMSYVGGMLGKNAYANLTNLTIQVGKGSYVKAESGIYRTYVGGVVGFMGEGNIKVLNVGSDIDVIGSTCDVGGISGIAHYGNTFENCVCTGNVTLVNANEEGDHLEIGGIAGVWMNSNSGKVTFKNCRFDGTLSSKLNGVDKSGEVADNKITGRKYNPNSNDGELIIE